MSLDEGMIGEALWMAQQDYGCKFHVRDQAAVERILAAHEGRLTRKAVDDALRKVGLAVPRGFALVVASEANRLTALSP